FSSLSKLRRDMGRFIGFAILAIVVLFTLAVLFRGESVIDDAVNQVRQTAEKVTPVVEPSPEEEEPKEDPPPRTRRKIFPDTTRLFDSERRAKWRTRDYSYVYLDTRKGRTPYQKIKYLELEKLDFETEYNDQEPIVRGVMVVHYQISPLFEREQQAISSRLLPRVYQESLHIEFEWHQDSWVMHPRYFANNPFDLKERELENHIPRVPAHRSLAKHLFQEFQKRKKPDAFRTAPGDNPYGNAISRVESGLAE
ncbi:MAG: hypothetical protein ACIALR_06175, partial [Blastopirellula sp. JB062]